MAVSVSAVMAWGRGRVSGTRRDWKATGKNAVPVTPMSGAQSRRPGMVPRGTAMPFHGKPLRRELRSHSRPHQRPARARAEVMEVRVDVGRTRAAQPAQMAG